MTLIARTNCIPKYIITAAPRRKQFAHPKTSAKIVSSYHHQKSFEMPEKRQFHVAYTEVLDCCLRDFLFCSENSKYYFDIHIVIIIYKVVRSARSKSLPFYCIVVVVAEVVVEVAIIVN